MRRQLAEFRPEQRLLHGVDDNDLAEGCDHRVQTIEGESPRNRQIFVLQCCWAWLFLDAFLDPAPDSHQIKVRRRFQKRAEMKADYFRLRHLNREHACSKIEI